MLCLRWDSLPKGFDKQIGKYKFGFEERTDLSTFQQYLLEENSLWERKFYKINSQTESFNENIYFHAYVNRSIFDEQQMDEKTTREINKSKITLYYEIDTNKEIDYYKIDTKNDGNFKLNLCGISLHVVNTGIAILTINLENYSYPEKKDVLLINEYGRRIYPQFLGDTFPHVTATKHVFLADKIEIACTKFPEGFIYDDFSEYNQIGERELHGFFNGSYKENWVVRPARFIRELFNSAFVFNAEGEKESKIRFNILNDDRMFFQSWYRNNELSNELMQINDQKKFGYQTSKYWHAFLFGDKSINDLGICNDRLLTELNTSNTYDRWIGEGTLYGFSKDSFICLTNSGEFASKLIYTQIKNQYYQLAVLCLIQRSSLLRFSAEVTAMADLSKNNRSYNLSANIKVLYKNYIEFVNKIYFREVTPYIQGIEMYKKFQEVMEIKANVENLNQELNELFDYVKLENDDAQNERAKRLNIMAFSFLPASLVFSVIGSGLVAHDKVELSTQPNWNAVQWILIGILISTLITMILFYLIKNKGLWK